MLSVTRGVLIHPTRVLIHPTVIKVVSELDGVLIHPTIIKVVSDSRSSYTPYSNKGCQ